MTAHSKTGEKERENERERQRYLTVRSHHTVRGRRLRVRRALGTRRTLWHHIKRGGKEDDTGGTVGRMRRERKRERETKVTKEGQTEKQGYCRAEDSRSARTKVWRKKNKKCTKYKTLVHVPNSKSVRLSREEQANDSLEWQKEKDGGCALFCLSVKTLRSVLHAACYHC